MAERCGAKTRQLGTPCALPPAKGATRCRFHGGATPKSKVAAEQRLAAAEATRFLHEQGVTPISDPLRAYADAASEAVAFKQFLASRIAQLQSLDTWGEQGNQVKAEVVLYERAVDRMERFLSTWVRLGLDERLVKLSEAQADLIDQVIRGVLTELGVPLDQARPIVARHLRLVS